MEKVEQFADSDYSARWSSGEDDLKGLIRMHGNFIIFPSDAGADATGQKNKKSFNAVPSLTVTSER